MVNPALLATIDSSRNVSTYRSILSNLCEIETAIHKSSERLFKHEVCIAQML